MTRKLPTDDNADLTFRMVFALKRVRPNQPERASAMALTLGSGTAQAVR